VPAEESELDPLPEDRELLAVMVRTLLAERNHEKHRAEEQKRHAEEQKQRAQAQAQRAEELQVELLRLRLELERFKKWYYGPRADRLQSTEQLSQLLLNFAEQLEQKPIHPGDVPPQTEQQQQRRVQRRKGRRHLANFENLPVTTRVYELSGDERACPCCGETRHEIGADESWQVEYLPGHFERIHHIRKKYACAGCEHKGEHPRMEVAAKPEAAIDKGMAGPGLLAYIVTSKFADYLPLYAVPAGGHLSTAGV
jgi:transposase